MTAKRLIRAAAGAFLLAALAGCGGTGDVSGRVTYQGKPVTSGKVMLVGADGTPHYGDIGADGAYRVAGVPTGEVLATVASPKPGEARPERPGGSGRGGDRRAPAADPAEAAAQAALAKRWFSIPEQYADPARSGLKVNVSRGGMMHDFELK
jgi:hypothetical protein